MIILKRCCFIITSMLFFIFANVFGQSNNYVGLNIGLSSFHIRDDHASPLFFRGVGFTPSAQFVRREESGIYSFELAYFYNNLASNNSSFNTNNYKGRVKFSYVHDVTDFNLLDKQIKLFIGAGASSFLSLSDYRYIDDNLAIKSWYWNHSLNFELTLLYDLNGGGYLSAQINTPFVGNISRPKYSPSEDYSYTENTYKVKLFGETKFFPNNFFLNGKFTYTTPVSSNFNFRFDYEFFYSFYCKPKEIDMYMNNVGIGLFFLL